MSPEVIDGAAALPGYFQGIAEEFVGIDFARHLFRESEHLEQLHTQYFNDEHGSDGFAWAPLAPSTVKRKGHNQILYETGDLERSVMDGHAKGAIREVDTSQDVQFLVFGTDIQYGEFHMTGTGNMPARPFVGMSPIYVDQATERTVEFALEAMRR